MKKTGTAKFLCRWMDRIVVSRGWSSGRPSRTLDILAYHAGLKLSPHAHFLHQFLYTYPILLFFFFFYSTAYLINGVFAIQLCHGAGAMNGVQVEGYKGGLGNEVKTGLGKSVVRFRPRNAHCVGHVALRRREYNNCAYFEQPWKSRASAGRRRGNLAGGRGWSYR